MEAGHPDYANKHRLSEPIHPISTLPDDSSDSGDLPGNGLHACSTLKRMDASLFRSNPTYIYGLIVTISDGASNCFNDANYKTLKPPFFMDNGGITLLLICSEKSALQFLLHQHRKTFSDYFNPIYHIQMEISAIVHAFCHFTHLTMRIFFSFIVFFFCSFSKSFSFYFFLIFQMTTVCRNQIFIHTYRIMNEYCQDTFFCRCFLGMDKLTKPQSAKQIAASVVLTFSSTYSIFPGKLNRAEAGNGLPLNFWFQSSSPAHEILFDNAWFDEQLIQVSIWKSRPVPMYGGEPCVTRRRTFKTEVANISSSPTDLDVFWFHWWYHPEKLLSWHGSVLPQTLSLDAKPCYKPAILCILRNKCICLSLSSSAKWKIFLYIWKSASHSLLGLMWLYGALTERKSTPLLPPLQAEGNTSKGHTMGCMQAFSSKRRYFRNRHDGSNHY